MIDLRDLDRYRLTSPEVLARWGSFGSAVAGVFGVPSPVDRAALRVIAASGEGWDHVSVSRRNRCPNWQEMQTIHRLFFKPDEVAMQLHVTPAQHVDVHPFCLHLWRPLDVPIPLPPVEFV